MGSLWLVAGSVSGFLSVALGAFGAHALENRLSERAIEIWGTAVQYQMFHSTALLVLGLWAGHHPTASTSVPGWAFIAGLVLFSGSLYALALSGVKILGAVTPFGGTAFLVGWIAFAVIAYRAGQTA